ncbi:nanos homolog 1 [Hoplias malabaricus]|uniref:nanos homolog 1 n=1 Tax=Hoplias malabaricus TaxID=27720 RepID=UPI0034621832
MDFLNHSYLSARASYDYTFNFWNDYLGLSTLVTKSSSGKPAGNNNSITASLKATLGLDEPCAQTECNGCGCCACGCGCVCACAPASLLELKERFSVLSPFGERDAAFGGGGGGSLAGLELFGAERKARRPTTRAKQEPKICVFCRNNGAPEEVYGSHVLKTPEGRVLCPILRAYTCPLCSANGDNAHTIKYCPLSKEQPAQRALKGGRAVGGKRVKLF